MTWRQIPFTIHLVSSSPPTEGSEPSSHSPLMSLISSPWITVFLGLLGNTPSTPPGCSSVRMRHVRVTENIVLYVPQRTPITCSHKLASFAIETMLSHFSLWIRSHSHIDTWKKTNHRAPDSWSKVVKIPEQLVQWIEQSAMLARPQLLPFQ